LKKTKVGVFIETMFGGTLNLTQLRKLAQRLNGSRCLMKLVVPLSGATFR